jgi:biopolymer transport protein ExbD
MPALPIQPRIGLKLLPTLPKPDGAFLIVLPLVDVLFLLLIFFMLGSSIVFQPGIQVDPPEVSTPPIIFADKLVITMTKENLLFFNDQPVHGMEDLAKRLDEVVNRYNLVPGKEGDGQRRRSRPPIIILKADKDAPYDDVVQIMSITRQFGARVFLVTRAMKP